MPKDIENEICQTAIKEDKPKAIKKVTELSGYLTGALYNHEFRQTAAAGPEESFLIPAAA